MKTGAGQKHLARYAISTIADTLPEREKTSAAVPAPYPTSMRGAYVRGDSEAFAVSPKLWGYAKTA